VIKCAVCGSENEAEALFCGTCGSPLSPAGAKAITQDTQPTVVEPTTPDESVVPGKGGARRDLGTSGGSGKTTTGPDVTQGETGTSTETVVTDALTGSGGPTIVCSVCGTVNDATRTYCRKCANELKPAATAPPPPPPPNGRRRISPLAIGLGAAAVVVALALVAVLALAGKGPVATLSPTTGATPSAAVVVGPTPIMTQPAPSAPAFTESAPKGTIVFSRCQSNTVCELFRIDPATGKEKGPLTTAGGYAADAAISNDGTRVAYTTKTGIRIMNLATGALDPTFFSKGPAELGPFWSPDDQNIVWAAARDRATEPAPRTDLEIRFDGVTKNGTSVPLTANAVTDHDPVYTPDGLSVIWVMGDKDLRDLRMINLKSRKVTDLTKDKFNDVDPAVSPDGTKLVFASTRTDGATFDLFLLNLTTPEFTITPLPTMKGDEHDPSWSPGGRYIVFSSGDGLTNDLVILDLADNSTRSLTSGPARDLWPAWH